MSVLEDSLVSIPENSRKHDIVTDVLTANGFKHIGHIRNEKIKCLLKSYTGMTSKIRGGLEDLGFHIEEKRRSLQSSIFGIWPLSGDFRGYTERCKKRKK